MHDHHNHETPEPTTEPTATRPAETLSEAPTPATRHEARILQTLLAERGNAFQVYLDRIWRDTAITDMSDEFGSLYWASYARVEEFVDDMADAQGWDSALEEFTRTWGIPKGGIGLNYGVLLASMQDTFEFIPFAGEIHVFIK